MKLLFPGRLAYKELFGFRISLDCLFTYSRSIKSGCLFVFLSLFQSVFFLDVLRIVYKCLLTRENMNYLPKLNTRRFKCLNYMQISLLTCPTYVDPLPPRPSSDPPRGPPPGVYSDIRFGGAISGGGN